MEGTIIGQKYRIIRKLGRGGTSDVYLAENLTLNNQWAIKAIGRQSDFMASEMQEIHILKNLSHPMLPRVADLLEDEHTVYIVMDYIKGEDLASLMAREGSFPEARVRSFCIQLCEVLAYLHDQKPLPVIYRDLKPSNIILDVNGRLHLIDFGTARTFKEEKTDDTVYIGTYGYAAPEQFGTGRSDERTDLYNLGMTLFHLLTGSHPAGLTPEDMEASLKRKGLSSGLGEIIRGLVHKEPGRRIKSARECLELAQKAEPKQNHAKAGHKPVKNMKLSIGLMGIHPGAGTTLAGLSLSLFLAYKGYPAAYVEMNGSGDMERLEKAFLGSEEAHIAQGNAFEAWGITLFKAIREPTDIPRKHFEALVLDFGCPSTERAFQEFNRADIRILVCSGMDWRLSKINEFMHSYGSMDPHQEWLYMITPGCTADEKSLSRLLKTQNILTFPAIRHLPKLEKPVLRHLEAMLDKAMVLSGLWIM